MTHRRARGSRRVPCCARHTRRGHHRYGRVPRYCAPRPDRGIRLDRSAGARHRSGLHPGHHAGSRQSADHHGHHPGSRQSADHHGHHPDARQSADRPDHHPDSCRLPGRRGIRTTDDQHSSHRDNRRALHRSVRRDDCHPCARVAHRRIGSRPCCHASRRYPPRTGHERRRQSGAGRRRPGGDVSDHRQRHSVARGSSGAAAGRASCRLPVCRSRLLLSVRRGHASLC